MDGVEDYYMVEENQWGAERGRVVSHLVSPSFANFPGGGAVFWCLGCLVVFVLFCCFLASEGISAVISFLLIKIPVVDRQCLVLARQCRKKKNSPRSGWTSLFCMAVTPWSHCWCHGKLLHGHYGEITALPPMQVGVDTQSQNGSGGW